MCYNSSDKMKYKYIFYTTVWGGIKMTGEQFVKLCYEEKKNILAEYFNPNYSSVVGKKISAITEQGISKDDLYDLLNLVLKENYYTLLLGLDGEASLGNTQMTYKLYDENGNLLNECGELEAAAYRYFVEE